MKEFDLKTQAMGIIELQNDLIEKLSTKRESYAREKIQLEKLELKMTSLHRDKLMDLAFRDDISESKDPRTGRPNKEWTQYLIDQELENDGEYIKLFMEIQEVKTNLFQAEADVLSLAERLGTTRSQSRLLAAMLEYINGTR